MKQALNDYQGYITSKIFAIITNNHNLSQSYHQKQITDKEEEIKMSVNLSYI